MEDKLKYGYELGERYVIRKALGKGTGGTVFLAFDNKLGKCWAVKACIGKTKRELEALKAIDHFAFPRIVDVLEQDNITFLIMDYIEGETLEKYCERHAVTERQVLIWGRKVAEALYYLHSCSPTLIYMDCKPENIMITPGGEIRLIDLGSIYVCDNEKDNVISGTVFYAPDEIKNFSLHNSSIGVGRPDERSDIYSLGMTMYYLLLGRKVEYRDRRGRLCLRRQNRNIGRLTEYIIQRCTRDSRKDRYQSMKDVSEDIRAVLGKSPKKLNLWGKCMAIPIAAKMVDIILKTILAFLILFFAEMFREGTGYGEYSILVMVLLMATFLLLCRSRTVYSWENRKSVYRGMGAKMLLLMVSIFGGMISAGIVPDRIQAAEHAILDLTLYDNSGRRLLVKPGCVWETEGDIFMSVDEDEVLDKECRITVICENGKETRQYSFMCAGRKNELSR